MIRAALFGSGGVADPAATDTAYHAQSAVYRARVTRREESVEEFCAWHSSQGNNTRKLVGGRVARAGHADPAAVGAALLELSWLTFPYTGVAVAAAMTRWLERAREYATLTAREEALFRLLYGRVPEAANIPLAVLYHRLEVLEPWFATAAAEPECPDWRVYHTLLGYYAHMARDRRQIDACERAAARVVSRDADVSAGARGCDDVPRAAAAAEEIAAIGERMRTVFGVTCDCPGNSWRAEFEPRPEVVHMRFVCGRCGRSEERDAGPDEFAAECPDLDPGG